MTITRTANWWKFLLVGAGVLAALIVTTTITGEVDSSMWLPMMIIMVGSLLTLAAGLVLGVSHLTAARRSSSPS